MSAGDLLFAVYSHPVVRAVLGLLVANVVSGIAVSLYTKQFRLAATADWLMSRAIPFLLGAGTLNLVLYTVPAPWSGVSEAATTAVWLFVCAALVGKILDNLREMGLPIPRVLTDRAKPDVTATP